MNLTTALKIIELTQNSYSQIANSFADSRNSSWAEIDEAIKKYVKPGDKILDLGCGSGRLLKSLKNVIPDSDPGSIPFSYLGIDNCSALIAKAQEDIKALKHENTRLPAPEAAGNGGQVKTKKTSVIPAEAGIQKSSVSAAVAPGSRVAARDDKNKFQINFFCQDILNLSALPDNGFNIIFMVASFHHIPSKELRQKVMANLQRLLKPGGILIMTNWNLWQIGPKKSIWNNILSSYKLRVINYELPVASYKLRLSLKDVITLWQNKHPLYYYAFTLPELKKLFLSAGFSILENSYVRRGKKASWWNGYNILTAGNKVIE